MTSPTPTLLLILLHLIALTSSKSTPKTHPRNRELFIAIEEMERANYFAFAMLINMSPPHLFHGNLTFLVPKDRALSRTVMPETAVSNFVLRHSIPSPMPFDYLQHLPMGSILPSSEPNFTLRVEKNRHRGFFLNNVRIVNPNICASGSSFRCHGVDGVLSMPHDFTIFPPPSNCSNSTRPVSPDVAVAPPSPPSSSWQAPPSPPSPSWQAPPSPSPPPPSPLWQVPPSPSPPPSSSWQAPPSPSPPPPLVGFNVTPPPGSNRRSPHKSGTSQGLVPPYKGGLLMVALMVSILGLSKEY